MWFSCTYVIAEQLGTHYSRYLVCKYVCNNIDLFWSTLSKAHLIASCFTTFLAIKEIKVCVLYFIMLVYASQWFHNFRVTTRWISQLNLIRRADPLLAGFGPIILKAAANFEKRFPSCSHFSKKLEFKTTFRWNKTVGSIFFSVLFVWLKSSSRKFIIISWAFLFIPLRYFSVNFRSLWVLY